MFTNYTEAQAHFNQLLSLGASEEQAEHDTRVAFDLNQDEADFLQDPMEYFNNAADLDAIHYAMS